jgi:hypothetical protein
MSELTLFVSATATVAQVEDAINKIKLPQGIDYVNVDDGMNERIGYGIAVDLYGPDADIAGIPYATTLSAALGGISVLTELQFFDAIDATENEMP